MCVIRRPNHPLDIYKPIKATENPLFSDSYKIEHRNSRGEHFANLQRKKKTPNENEEEKVEKTENKSRQIKYIVKII